MKPKGLANLLKRDRQEDFYLDDIERDEFGECVDKEAELDRLIEKRRESFRKEYDDYIEYAEGEIY